MPAQNSKSIALTSTWSHWVDELVASGEYKSASEVVRDGLRSLRDDRARRDAELAEIQARLKVTLAQAEASQFAEGTGEDAVRRAFTRARDASNS